MKVFSPVFQDGKLIPTKYAYHGVVGGKNISIPLSWSGAPAETQSLALSIVDPHPVANNWVHWFVVNIPANVTSLAEGASGKNMPAGSKEFTMRTERPVTAGPSRQKDPVRIRMR